MINKIIIFCGCDNTGKTTIAQELCKQTGFQYFKNKQEHNSFVENSFIYQLNYGAPLVMQFIKQIEFKNNGIILDRFVPCEFAYSSAFKRESNRTLIWKIDEELASLNALLIYCYKTKFKNFSDEIIFEKNIEDIIYGYERYFSKTKMNVLKLDTTNENLELQIEQIKNYV